ncbi:O-antigen translocase [Aestuariivivens sp. NBU2969]|uniref:O-antigen translocase n=1 Tax=Aestuariivivens sp. NBU2969 TaxID=2873267 RepID=UPI001CBE4EBF|nr:O-antigen translocase [Aestuariivivens sp. NBU2969]
MKGIKKILINNLLFKITSVNTVVISIRLIISLIVQRVLAVTVGEVGIAKIGQIRNLIQIITSTSSLGMFNGIVKYVAEHKEDNKRIGDLFSTAFILVFLGSVLTSTVMLFFALTINDILFVEHDFVWLIRVLALLPVVIGINRVFYGVVNGFSEYKKYAVIDLLSYIFSVALLVVCLYYYGLEGVLFSIVVTPIIQLVVIVYILGKVLKRYIDIRNFSYKIPLGKELLAFMLMSFVSTGLLNYIELDIRTMITNRIDMNEAGYWTAMNFISKNYMAFSSAIFTLYVIPKFSRIYDRNGFLKEVINIYKTLLPLFGLGMLLIYIFRDFIINIIYPNFVGLEPLFKWQLMGDFIRLASLVIAHQFLAKKLVKSFIFTELISLGLFFVFSKYLVDVYGATGVVMAHFYRFIVYLVVVIIVVWGNFYKLNKNNNP